MQFCFAEGLGLRSSQIYPCMISILCLPCCCFTKKWFRGSLLSKHQEKETPFYESRRERGNVFLRSLVNVALLLTSASSFSIDNFFCTYTVRSSTWNQTIYVSRFLCCCCCGWICVSECFMWRYHRPNLFQCHFLRSNLIYVLIIVIRSQLFQQLVKNSQRGLPFT